MKDKLETRSFLILLLLVSVAFLWVLKPFWMSIFWACAVAVIFYPLQRKLRQSLGDKPNRNALLTLTIAVVIVVIPVLGIAYSFIQEGVQFYQKVDSGEIRPGEFLQQIETAFPFIPDLLATLGIGHLGDRIIHKLSGGEKRLVCLAGLLAMRPDVLLLDEPTNGVDTENGGRLREQLRGFGGAMILVSHDDGFVAELASRALVLEEGRLRAAEIHEHPHMHSHAHVHALPEGA